MPTLYTCWLRSAITVSEASHRSYTKLQGNAARDRHSQFDHETDCVEAAQGCAYAKRSLSKRFKGS